jgi:hypothetical protein
MVLQLVEALRYKPESRGSDSRCGHCDFSFIYSFRPHYGPGVDSASNRSEYQEYLLGGERARCVGLTTLPPSCLEILEASTSWSHTGLSRPVMRLLYL